jgi:acyl-CoA dehydrogenase
VRAQAGITFLLIDMSSPGISIRPIVNIAGDHEFNQVFFDEVRVPKINRVSEENAGWAVAKHLLEFERGGNYAAGLRARLAWVRRLAVDGLADDESFRGRLARAEIEVTAVEMQERRVISALSLGEAPGNAASLLKLQGSELTQRLDELAIEAVGPRMSTVDVQADVAMGRYLYDRSVTIFGGTSEIQRNIIARTVLAL